MTEKPEWVKQIEAQPCMCVPCQECRGTGTVYWMFDEYCGPDHPCDDLANPEPCPNCENGIIAMCERCADLEDYEAGEMEASLD